ncbi:MAG: copper oxidase [Bdellovibrionales bacterium]|nr:copper oxidase [Bdellovibrionales bacterium]
MFKLNLNRRSFLSAVGFASLPVLASAATKGGVKLNSGGHEHHNDDKKPEPVAPVGANNSAGYVPVVTPGIQTLPYELDGDVKVFNLIAEPVVTQFQDMSDPHGARRRPIHGWGYNGSIIGPTIEAVEGDRVRIIVENRLPEPTTVHWHGLHVPIEMDGVTGTSQDPIEPGQSFVYEFTLEQHGTYFYHPHFMGAKQVGLGMSGFFIIHPKNPSSDQIVARDYAYFLQTWMIQPGSPIPDTLEMVDFNYFTMNGKPAPDIVPMQAKSGERVRIRVANLSMLTHPIHLHGHSFKISDWGAGFLPLQQQILANTTDISSAEVRALEFVAGRKGKWLLHCHFMHHTMNDMHRNPIGNKGGGHAAHEMGGMHTWIEVV